MTAANGAIERAIVVGAGIVGACVALRLARRGVAVTVLDARTPGAGTSSTTFAWIDANPSPYQELSVAGVAAWGRAREELGDPRWLTLTGTLSWDGAGSGRAGRVAALRALGHPAEAVSPARAHELEPDLLVDGVESVAWFPSEGHLFTIPALAELLARARALGAELRTGAAVSALERDGGRVTGVTLAGGERLEADAVITCAGRWTDQLAALAGVAVPLTDPEPAGSRAVGLLALTTPTACRLSRVLLADGLMIRPDGAGRLLLHADEIDDRVRVHTATAPPPPEADALVAMARRHLGGLEGVQVEAARIGIRVLPADRLPVVGSALDGLYVVATHSGVTLGPLLGELVTAELVDGRPAGALERYRPSRFVSA